MTRLLDKLVNFRPFRALVVGDFMLDRHRYGAAERLSPDAPVPVLLLDRDEDKPGGAANVARCLVALGATVRCLGVVGNDATGAQLCAALAAEGIDVDGIVPDAGRPTTVKESLIGLAQHRHPQKMFRVDVEPRAPVSNAVAEQLLAAVDAVLGATDVVVLEDYNKGVCTPEVCRGLIERCHAAGVEVLVDPASIDDYAKYRGATAITPNRSEAERATGLDTPIEASELHNAGLAAKLGASLDLDAVVLTLDRHGALLEERGGEPVLVPTVARSVYDVTGAGDIVLAALAAARANGLGWYDAVRFANAAAGLEVERFGAQAIPLAEIQSELVRIERTEGGKVRAEAELLLELAALRHAGQRIVFTNGCFDVIHAGHVGYLREAKQQGDVLVVAVNDDAQVHAQKGDGRPVYPLPDRLDILAELECVDYLVAFATPTVDELLRAVRPDVYVKGGDYDPDEINEAATLKELGIELRLLANRPGLGSTQVIAKLRE